MTERDAIIRRMSPDELALYAAGGGKLPEGGRLRRDLLAVLDQLDRERPKMGGRAWRWRRKEAA